MIVNLVASVVGCLLLAFVNVASFLCCLGCEARHPGLGIPVWMLLMAGAVLPLLGCVCCFYLSMSCDAPRCRPVVHRRPDPRAGSAPPATLTPETLFPPEQEHAEAEVEREVSLV